MIKHVYSYNTDKWLRDEIAQPVHAVDFCDNCGDCLYCESGTQCFGHGTGEHFWVVYADEPEPAALDGQETK